MRPTPLALAILFACSPAKAANIQTVPIQTAPLTPSPVLAQLRLDLAFLQKPGIALPPQAFANLSALVSLPQANAAATGTATPSRPKAKMETDALARVELAQQVLGKFDAETFAKLPAGQQQLALDSLWDNWKSKGLVESQAPADPLAGFDAALSDGVNDKKLTAANKSIFLGAGVLGYPLTDSVWLANMRIRDALDENLLLYPKGQKWQNVDGTPEFLGTTKEGQETLDAWGRAVDYARLVIRAVELGSKALPKSAEIAPEAAARFAALVAELEAGGDAQAVAYLRDSDPTFVAFLLDARKPGYFLYNGDGSVVSRIMAAKAAGKLGIRRLDQKEGAVQASTYFYRPRRVAERAAAVADGPASRDAVSVRDAMKPYAVRMSALAKGLPADPASPQGWTFVEPEFLESSVLDSKANALETYPEAAKVFSRYDLPITAATVRERRRSGYGALNDKQWRALLSLYDAVPELRKAPATTSLRVVSQAYETGGKLVAKERKGGGLALNLHLLNRLAALEGDAAAHTAFLMFAATAASAALQP